MYLSRIRIANFRNFKELDVALAGNVVVVGENRVGKSNLLYALRLLLDPTLPDSARQLGFADFWDGLVELSATDKIRVCVEIEEFDDDEDILATLTDYRLNDDPDTVRLTYEFKPKAGLGGEPTTEDDYEFLCYGGESEEKRFGHDLRRRITMDVLQALRDAEGDLSTWRRSPLRPLIEDAFKDISINDLSDIRDAIAEATEKITEFETVEALEKSIGDSYVEMSGPRQNIEPRLGFSATDPVRLYRNIRLLIDEGERGISDASLGSANLVFLSLKLLEIRRLIEENRRDHTLLAIEEPEAHSAAECAGIRRSSHQVRKAPLRADKRSGTHGLVTAGSSPEAALSEDAVGVLQSERSADTGRQKELSHGMYGSWHHGFSGA